MRLRALRRLRITPDLYVVRAADGEPIGGDFAGYHADTLAEARELALEALADDLDEAAFWIDASPPAGYTITAYRRIGTETITDLPRGG